MRFGGRVGLGRGKAALSKAELTAVPCPSETPGMRYIPCTMVVPISIYNLVSHSAKVLQW